MKRKVLKNLLICLSVLINVVLVCTVLFSSSSKANQHSARKDQERYRLQNDIVYDQLFYGKWRITEYILPKAGLPRSYSSFDKNGAFIGGNEEMINAIIGEEIIFETDCAEFSGIKHEYAYEPETYTHALLSDEQSIWRYSAKELELTGNTYSIVYFLLPGNYQVAGFENHTKVQRINDLYILVLKDNNTIYASNGAIMYLLERVE